MAMENKIKEFRQNKKMTQEFLADRLGVTRQTIIAIEKGGYVPSLELAFKIAKEFNQTIEKVFTYEK